MNAPAGLELLGATADQIASVGVNDGGDWGGGFYWAGGGVATNDQTDQTPNVGMVFPAPSSYWGLQMVCGKATCSANALLAVQAVTLYVRETTPPNFAATGLWQASGWIRGSWPFFAWSDSPSGVCAISTTLNGLPIASTSSPSDTSYVFHQCAAPAINQTVDTSRYGNGALPLVLASSDAAGVPASTSATIDVDNLQPTVSLSGPADAPSTVGTQYVTATASAGPSGVDGISCSVDGAPAQWYSASSAQVPVSDTVGLHQVQCFAESNAVDPNGVHGTSAPESFTMNVGAPTIAAVGFNRIVDKLRCRRVTANVRIPARWVTVTVNGRRVRVHERAHRQRVRVTRCHVRTVRRRVAYWVTVRRHGHKVRVRRHKIVRVALLPHTVTKSRRVVGHGRGTMVNGWLGTPTGVALAGQAVQVLTAADNGRNNYHVAATVTTAANGGWSARIGPGPSRLIRASYPGAAGTEPAESAPATLSVPAKIELLRVTPRRVAWGGTVRIVGRLVGGYFPPGGALVRLRIGEGSAAVTYGVREHVGGHHGQFTTTYTFGAGEAAVHRAFWFELATLPMGDYPYAPANSNRRSVRVGGRPPPPPNPRRHQRPQRRR